MLFDRKKNQRILFTKKHYLNVSTMSQPQMSLPGRSLSLQVVATLLIKLLRQEER